MITELSKAQPSRERLRKLVLRACALGLSMVLGAGCLEPLCRTAEIPDAGSALGDAVFAGTIAQQNLFESSCNLTGVPEGAFSWVAPSSGRYRFGTAGSAIATVLSVRTGDACEGAELACDFASGPELTGQADVWLEAGEMVYVVVEDWLGASGSFVVHIHELVEQECNDYQDDDEDGLIDCADPDCGCSCPNGTLSPVLDQPFTGTTAGGNNASEGSCGGSTAPDVSLVWTPPSTGLYRIDTDGSTFDTVLYVQEGDVCGGRELACDVAGGVPGLDAVVELALEGGVPVIVTVDGFAGQGGNFALNIEAVPELDCAGGFDDDADGAADCDDSDCDCTCQTRGLGSALGPLVYMDSDTFRGRGDASAGSCGGEGVADASFLWTAPAAGAYAISSRPDTMLHVHEGEVCGGAELTCDPFGYVPEVALAAGQRVVITVDNLQPGLHSMILSIHRQTERACDDGDDNDGDGAIDCGDDDCDCTCPAADDLGSALGEPVAQGSTALRDNQSGGSCGGGNAPDASFLWTAPEDGSYRIHTNGSSFDTVLYVDQGDVCGGDELVCDDDDGDGFRSQVELGLAAGQSVVITVDGFGTDAGDFALSIECTTCE